MTRLATLGIAVLTSCGFSVNSANPDARPTDATDATADDAPPDAAPLGLWSAPTRLDFSTPNYIDDDPSLTGDMLELYFATNRPSAGALGGEDIWFTTRATITSSWSPPAAITALNSTATDSNVEVSRDGLRLTFSSNRNGNFDLWYALRPTRVAAWGSPVRSPDLSSNLGDWGVVVTDDGLRAVLCSDRAGDEKLFETRRASTGVAWDLPQAITALDSVDDDCDGSHGQDEIYFASDRPGGVGDLDLWSAETTSTRFDTLTNLAPLNSTFRDSDPWISPDQRTLYFSSNRAGDDDLYVTTR